MSRRLALAALLLLPALAGMSGCPRRHLILSLPGFAPLQNGFHYEGWVILNGTPLSTGKFNLDDEGDFVTLGGRRIPHGVFRTSFDLDAASAVVLTIEPAGDTDAIPTATKVAAGALTNDLAVLTVGSPLAIGNDFAGASGRFLLATPTDGSPDTHEYAGIWFIDNSSGSGMPGLILPALPAGFKYEGWVVFDGRPLTTGTFTNPAAADEAAPFSGPFAGPPFPGEDFLENAPAGFTFPITLVGRTAVVTIEPFPDDSPAPFFLKPLVAQIPAGVHVSRDMENRADEFPIGVAVIR